MRTAESQERINPAAIALELGVSSDTVSDWIEEGRLVGVLVWALKVRNREIDRLRRALRIATAHSRGITSHNGA